MCWKSVLRTRKISASIVDSWTKWKHFYYSHKNKDTIVLWRGEVCLVVHVITKLGQKESQIHLMHFCEDRHIYVVPNGCPICSWELSKIIIPLVKEKIWINSVIIINMRALFKVCPLITLMPAWFSDASCLFPLSLRSLCCKDDSAACPRPTKCCELLRKSQVDLSFNFINHWVIPTTGMGFLRGNTKLRWEEESSQSALFELSLFIYHKLLTPFSSLHCPCRKGNEFISFVLGIVCLVIVVKGKRYLEMVCFMV